MVVQQIDRRSVDSWDFILLVFFCFFVGESHFVVGGDSLVFFILKCNTYQSKRLEGMREQRS